MKHILIELTNIKCKEKILKSTKENQQIAYKGTPIKMTADFSAETLQARREWQDIFKVIKRKARSKNTLPFKAFIQI